MKTTKILHALITVVLMITANSVKAQGGEWGEEGAQSQPCVPGATTWFLGGNLITTPPPQQGPVQTPPNPVISDAGTCNNYPFILKANNFKSVFIMPGGNIGINNPNPLAALDVRNPNASTQSSFRIFADPWGNVESTVDMRLYYATGKNFMLNEGTSASGTSYTNRLFVQNTTGNVGIGTMAPSSKFEIVDPAAVRMNIYSSAVPAASSKIWVSNTAYSFNFGIDNTGIGRIGSNINYVNQVNLINYRTDVNNMPLVWIGDVAGAPNTAELSVNVAGNANAIDVFSSGATSPANKVVFRVKNTGFVYAQEISVQVANYPDYVFKKDYKLMPLERLEKYIQQNHHLPNVPSAAEIEKDGANLGALSKIQMEKIEELTLYVIELKKEIESLKTTKKNN